MAHHQHLERLQIVRLHSLVFQVDIKVLNQVNYIHLNLLNYYHHIALKNQRFHFHIMNLMFHQFHTHMHYLFLIVQNFHQNTHSQQEVHSQGHFQGLLDHHLIEQVIHFLHMTHKPNYGHWLFLIIEDTMSHQDLMYRY